FASMISAPAGADTFAPTASIRCPRMTMVPRSITGPLIGLIFAFVIAMGREAVLLLPGGGSWESGGREAGGRTAEGRASDNPASEGPKSEGPPGNSISDCRLPTPDCATPDCPTPDCRTPDSRFPTPVFETPDSFALGLACGAVVGPRNPSAAAS